jgi:hypothetical protein
MDLSRGQAPWAPTSDDGLSFSEGVSEGWGSILPPVQVSVLIPALIYIHSKPTKVLGDAFFGGLDIMVSIKADPRASMNNLILFGSLSSTRS